MSNSRRNKCDGRTVDISSTHIPTITPSGNDDGCSFKSFLTHHMAEGHITTAAANLLLDVMNNAKFYQTQDALTPGEDGFYRYGNAYHGPPGSMYADLPISVDTPEARSTNDKFLAMISNYGRVLNVPEHNMPLTKASCRGYEATAGVGDHNDYRGIVNGKKHNLRTCLGVGAEKIITLTFHQPNEDPEKGPTVYYLSNDDESEKEKKKWKVRVSNIEKKFPEGFSFYGMSEFASGIRSLCFDGEKNVIVNHAIRVGEKRHVTVVIDYYFDTMDQLMAALRIMEEVPMHADISDGDEANALNCILGHQNNMVHVSHIIIIIYHGTHIS
jgi:hypothetical protein